MKSGGSNPWIVYGTVTLVVFVFAGVLWSSTKLGGSDQGASDTVLSLGQRIYDQADDNFRSIRQQLSRLEALGSSHTAGASHNAPPSIAEFAEPPRIVEPPASAAILHNAPPSKAEKETVMAHESVLQVVLEAQKREQQELFAKYLFPEFGGDSRVAQFHELSDDSVLWIADDCSQKPRECSEYARLHDACEHFRCIQPGDLDAQLHDPAGVFSDRKALVFDVTEQQICDNVLKCPSVTGTLKNILDGGYYFVFRARNKVDLVRSMLDMINCRHFPQKCFATMSVACISDACSIQKYPKDLCTNPGRYDGELRKIAKSKKTDKVLAKVEECRYLVEKPEGGAGHWGTHDYMWLYEKYLEPTKRMEKYKNSDGINLLEIGLGCNMGGFYDLNDGPKVGRSVRVWRDYFKELVEKKGKLNVLEYARDCVTNYDKDIRPEWGGNEQIWVGSQMDAEFLWSVGEGIGGLDVMIDDGSHTPIHIVNSFKSLWPYVNPGGLYFMEDLAANWVWIEDRVKWTPNQLVEGDWKWFGKLTNRIIKIKKEDETDPDKVTGFELTRPYDLKQGPLPVEKVKPIGMWNAGDMLQNLLGDVQLRGRQKYKDIALIECQDLICVAKKYETPVR